MIKSFRDLDVYKEAYELMLSVHGVVKKLPLFERNDLASQMRRASKSCPSNIAEGWAKRRFEKEFKHYLDAALGSANEMEVHLETARDLGYLDTDMCNDLLQKYAQLGGKLYNLQRNWKTY
ncbi:MAG: four helix bundle protein [Candidatus Levybacteria bacterium CG_4_10_14_0_2_um_filter_36_16]|nr:MAG: four helix bundle protein [Candidatus Levybacteria bacterium CG10_big_fil_rev_8_21_14_0_10_36_30]PIZ97378.1 MAG: four helix bundle protein [Candidatus Levybacteria bacterium CG_4_10_14_0_2_um_filter_36_16]